MSLIKCSECNQDVSTLGAASPHCGNPIASKEVPQPVVSRPVAGESPSAVVPAAKSITSLAEIAKCQKSVLWMLLLNLAGLVASLWFPIVGLAVGVILLFFIYRLAAALHTMAWLYAIAAIVPVVGLFSLLHLDRMATRALRKAGLKVGLMGVTEEALRTL